jgi:membrane dipeptidase
MFRHLIDRTLQGAGVLAILLASGAAAAAPAPERVHADALVLDAHADIEIPGRESPYVGEDGRSQVAPDKMAAGGVDAVVMAIAVGPGPRTPEAYAAARRQADDELQAVRDLVAEPANGLVLARSSAELAAAHESGERALILGFQNARILDGDPTQLDHWYEAGVRVFALTHMGHNRFADSSRPLWIADLGRHEPLEEHGGLSDLGRDAIGRINGLGGIVDISQLSRNATLEVLRLSEAPVIASHSAARALTDVSRNLSDEELDALAANGGVIHVPPFRGYLYDSTDPSLDRDVRAARRAAGIAEDYFYPFELYWEIEDETVKNTFLGAVSERLGPGSVDQMLDHIDHIVARIGVEHVGIGTDFNHGSGLAGFAGAAGAPNITRGLLERGYTSEEVALIWGGNFQRVWRAAEAAAR